MSKDTRALKFSAASEIGRNKMLPKPVPSAYSTEKSSSYFSDPLTNIIWQSMLIAGVLIYGSHSVLINLCKVDGKIPFSSASVVLLIELTKLIFSLSLLLPKIRDGYFALPGIKTIAAYSIPAFLYCINNNLVVHVQLYLDPASFQVLSNLKIVTTAILYKLIINRQIPQRQWMAIILITFGGISNSYGGIINSNNNAVVQNNMDEPSQQLPHQIFVTFFGIVLMLVYCTISGLAGVYTEYILKGQYKLSLHLQNTMLYIFGVIFNFSAYVLENTPGDVRIVHGEKSFFSGYTGFTVLIILTQAGNGLIMSAVMKHASNLTRLLVIACAMIVTTLLSVFLLSLRLNFYFLFAFLLILISLKLYHG